MHVEQTQLDQLMPLLKETLAKGQSVLLSPSGVSMLPMLRQGVDSVVISPIKGRIKKYDLPLYQRDNGQYVLHRVIKTGKTYICIGDNQFIKERGLRHDQFIGVVTAFYRKDQKIFVDNYIYQIYCHIWHYTRFIRRVWRKICSYKPQSF